jgi:hypothetical protein
MEAGISGAKAGAGASASGGGFLAHAESASAATTTPTAGRNLRNLRLTRILLKTGFEVAADAHRITDSPGMSRDGDDFPPRVLERDFGDPYPAAGTERGAEFSRASKKMQPLLDSTESKSYLPVVIGTHFDRVPIGCKSTTFISTDRTPRRARQ